MPLHSTPFSRLLVLGSGLMLGAFAVHGQVLDRSIEAENRITRQAAQAQEQINQVDEETQQLINEKTIVLSTLFVLSG